MTLTTISRCGSACRLHLYRLFHLHEYVRCMLMVHDRLVHTHNPNWFFFLFSHRCRRHCRLIACSPFGKRNTPRIYTKHFFLLCIKYIYGHIVPINFISLNSFSAITCLHIHAQLWKYYMIWNAHVQFGRMSSAREKKTISKIEWQLRLCYPNPKTEWAQTGRKVVIKLGAHTRRQNKKKKQSVYRESASMRWWAWMSMETRNIIVINIIAVGGYHKTSRDVFIMFQIM